MHEVCKTYVKHCKTSRKPTITTSVPTCFKHICTRWILRHSLASIASETDGRRLLAALPITCQCGFNGWPLGCTGTVGNGGSKNAVSNNNGNINSHEFILFSKWAISETQKSTKTTSTSSTNLPGSLHLPHFCIRMMYVAIFWGIA